GFGSPAAARRSRVMRRNTLASDRAARCLGARSYRAPSAPTGEPGPALGDPAPAGPMPGPSGYPTGGGMAEAGGAGSPRRFRHFGASGAFWSGSHTAMRSPGFRWHALARRSSMSTLRPSASTDT